MTTAGDPSVTFETFVLKAAAKAFNNVFPDHPSDINRYQSGGLKHFT